MECGRAEYELSGRMPTGDGKCAAREGSLRSESCFGVCDGEVLCTDETARGRVWGHKSLWKTELGT